MNLLVFFVLMKLAVPKCGCDHIRTFDESKYVFRGVVKSIERIDSPYIRYDVTFGVETWRKGKRKTKSMKVSVPCLVDGCCGIPFEVNRRYDVYTFMRYGLDYTNDCTQTSKVSSK